MTDQEIIEKYREKIEEQIQNYFNKHHITDKRYMEEFTANYKRRFVQGFHQGREEQRQKNLEEKQEIAKKLIQEGLAVSEVSSITGLPIDQIKASL